MKGSAGTLQTRYGSFPPPPPELGVGSYLLRIKSAICFLLKEVSDEKVINSFRRKRLLW